MPRTSSKVEPPSFPVGSPYREIHYYPSHRSSIQECIPWLHQEGLLIAAATSSAGMPPSEAWAAIEESILYGLPAHRPTPTPLGERNRLGKEYASRLLPGGKPAPSSKEALELAWADHLRGQQYLQAFEVSPISPDAIACYRPFHCDPQDWGIFVSIPALFEHCEILCKAFSSKLYLVGNLESILRCVLFEVFHHEFFHHIVESTATTLEIVSAAFGKPRPFYREYLQGGKFRAVLGEHPHEPLEEALANAYAYNSLSFLSRAKFGARTIEARLYQAAMRKAWAYEGPGYRAAAHYVADSEDPATYVNGGALLLTMLLGTRALHVPSLLLLAKQVMPRGHTAFLDKPHVPTQFIGSKEFLRTFLDLVPTPNEAYTDLFWIRETADLDEALRKRRKEEKERRRLQRTLGSTKRGPAVTPPP